MSSAATLPGPSILVVSDDAVVGQTLEPHVTRAGFRLESVPDGSALLERIRRAPPRLVLLDLTAAGSRCWTLCRRIRSLTDVPVILLSRRYDVATRVTGLELGADDVVETPFEPSELMARIRAVLRRSQAGEE